MKMMGLLIANEIGYKIDSPGPSAVEAWRGVPGVYTTELPDIAKSH